MDPKSVVMKKALREGRQLFGTFICLPSVQTIEVMASSGFDFMVFDAEHAPTNPALIHTQLMAISHVKTASVVRIAAQDPNLVKSYLDLGADSLMVPNIETADQAKEVVRMMRYPPQGYRGVGGSMGMQMRRKTRQQRLPLPQLAAPVMQATLAAERAQRGGAQGVQLLLVAHQGLQAGCAVAGVHGRA